MITVKEICSLLSFYTDDEEHPMEINIAADGVCKPFSPESGIEMAAYGDFVISEIAVSHKGVDLEIKREFVKATA
nr:MAG TPA: hypothetical protein [Caudoviricetes sp.]